MDVAAACRDTDLPNDGNRLVAQPLIFPVCEGLGRGHCDRIPCVHPHRIKVFDAADDHDVVRQITHHLKLEFLPAQQRLLDQNLRDRTRLQPALANRCIFLWVVGNAPPTSTQGEGGPDDPGETADRGPNGFGLFLG